MLTTKPIAGIEVEIRCGDVEVEGGGGSVVVRLS
jgi:hypothetical protein